MDIGFIFDCEDTEPEIVMLESHYEHMISDIADMEGEITYLRIMVEYLLDAAVDEGLDTCICADCIADYIEKKHGRH